MSNFGEELNRQLEVHKIGAQDLAGRVSMSASQIYNWLRGTQVSVSPEQFNLLAAALSDDETVHARLLHAHLLDEKTDALGSHLVEVTLQISARVHDAPRARSKRERALEILAAESVRDRSLAELLVSLAGYINSDLAEAEKKIVRVVKKETR